ncbi:hypothetical protein JB92DRAFT_3096414 [Gautieria morchelliformis]|nr:hypothetical protein JB92DRAFT_3096414 [Gautieria morchelliformis]
MNAVSEPIASRGPSKEPEVVGGATKEPGVEGDSMRESENEGENTRTPKKARKERAQSLSPEIVTVELTPAHRRKARGTEEACEVGEAGKMCGRCIRDRQGCVAAEEYVAKDEKDGREPEVKERGSKGKSKAKAKEKGSTTGPSSISSKGVLGKPVVPPFQASLADSQIPLKAPEHLRWPARREWRSWWRGRRS